MTTTSLRRIAAYAGLALDAWRLRRSDEEQVQRQARRHLIERMGKLRGLPQKLGQMLSFTADEDSLGAAADYSLLQQQAEPLQFDAIEPLLEAAWGRPVDDVLADMDHHAAAASLGQVHRATLHDGRQVAVKVQYPGIRDAVTTDIKLLGWLSAPLGNLRHGFDLNKYRQAILEDLQRELDYRQEARWQHAFAVWADEPIGRSTSVQPFLIVPRPVDVLCTDTVLVSQWRDGDTWETVREQWSESQRRELATNLLRFFFVGLFQRAMLHADWHPGNVRFRRDAGSVQLVLYDYGCVYQPTDIERLALLRLIRATAQRNESPYPLFLKLGFQEQFLEPLAAKLPALCQVLFEPFCAQYPYDVAQWRLSERVADVLGEDRWNFRIAGPPALVFLLRSLHGLSTYLHGLRTPVFWSRAIEPCLAALHEEMNGLELDQPQGRANDLSSLARYLKIRVRENGSTKVELTGYSMGIDDLEELLGEELAAKIRDRGIDLSAIVSDVRRRGYSPGRVFELEEGTKHVAVWLE